MPTKKPTKSKAEKKPAKPISDKKPKASEEVSKVAKALGKKVEKPIKQKDVINTGYSTRGRVFEGKVISDKMAKTVTVEWPRQIFLPKFERFEKRRTRVKAHVPDGIEVKVDDFVKIAECRPISKTKNFVVVEVRKNESN